VPKIKISENVAKVTNPHYKKVYRLYDRDTGKAIADQLCVYDEKIDDSRDLTIFDPDYTWKKKTVKKFVVRELLEPIFINGELVYKEPSYEEICSYCAAQIDTLWDEIKRFENPHKYYVDMSKKLWCIKNQLLAEKL
jgi:nicotinate phosphoribosyltransferase